MIQRPTQIKEIFRDVEGASQIIEESPQFDENTTKSLMEVMNDDDYFDDVDNVLRCVHSCLERALGEI